MNFQSLHNELRQNKTRSFYIFAGEEWEAQKIYINQIAKIKGYKICRVDSIKDNYNQLQNKSFLKENFVYVSRDDKEFIQSEKMQVGISKILGDNIYILLLTTVDKRTKFYKKYKDDIVEFEHFDDKILTKYIQKEINLSPVNCKKLIDICESDYGRILLEIDKIRRYANARNLERH